MLLHVLLFCQAPCVAVSSMLLSVFGFLGSRLSLSYKYISFM